MTDSEKAKAKAKLNRFTENASPDDVKKIDRNLDGMNKGPIMAIWENVQLLYKLVKDPSVPFVQKTPAIGGLIYLISPIDAIPDILPGIGLADDAAVIGIVIAALMHLLAKYKKNNNTDIKSIQN
ncbi:MAG: DUF1232 domain-containing protein [Spirochaetales bacterium]